MALTLFDKVIDALLYQQQISFFSTYQTNRFCFKFFNDVF
jgi:hypothetical protein